MPDTIHAQPPPLWAARAFDGLLDLYAFEPEVVEGEDGLRDFVPISESDSFPIDPRLLPELANGKKCRVRLSLEEMP